MRKRLLLITMLGLCAPNLFGQSWSIAGGTGPFIFGRFAERTMAIGNEAGSATTKSRLSAATRAGLAVDIEHSLNDRLAVRLETTWTRAPLRIKAAGSSQGIDFDAGKVNLTTFVVPLVVRLNPHGALRFDVFGGPAYALYNVHRRVGGGATVPLFEGTRGRWGGAGGLGVAWWWTSRFAAEWQAQDIVTGSPFKPTDIAPAGKGVHIPKPQNGHTTIGIRYRF